MSEERYTFTCGLCGCDRSTASGRCRICGHTAAEGYEAAAAVSGRLARRFVRSGNATDARTTAAMAAQQARLAGEWQWRLSREAWKW